MESEGCRVDLVMKVPGPTGHGCGGDSVPLFMAPGRETTTAEAGEMAGTECHKGALKLLSSPVIVFE